MANHKSSEKRARQTLRKTARNNMAKKAVKTAEKRVLTNLSTKAAEATEALREYTAKMMKAVSKGIMKKQTASRKIARVSKRVSAATAAK